MEYHEVMIKDRLESMKSDVENRVLSFNGELGKFGLRWNEIKPQKVAVQVYIWLAGILSSLGPRYSPCYSKSYERNPQ